MNYSVYAFAAGSVTVDQLMSLDVGTRESIVPSCANKVLPNALNAASDVKLNVSPKMLLLII